ASLLHLVGVALLVVGCAPVRPGMTDSLLVPRILAPAGVGNLPPPGPAPPQAKLGSPELLPEPRRRPSGTESPPPAHSPSLAKGGHEPGPDALTLDDAVDLAFKNQPRLRLYQERVLQARSRGDAAFAAYLPQLAFFSRAFAGENPHGPPGGFALPLAEF